MSKDRARDCKARFFLIFYPNSDTRGHLGTVEFTFLAGNFSGKL
jgi:hypothetical protein